MSDGFGLAVRFTLKPGHEEAFDQLVSATVAGIRDQEPGTLVYACHMVKDRPELRMFYELYRDRAAFDVHEDQPHVRHFLAERGQHLAGVEVDFLEAVRQQGRGGITLDGHRSRQAGHASGDAGVRRHFGLGWVDAGSAGR